MESKIKNRVYLHELEDWDDFDRVVNVVTEKLNWTELEQFKGPEFTRIAKFSKGPINFTLVYDDMWGMAIQCDGDASHLPELSKEILAAL